ncbi:MAG: class I SAM-dependent methyltransferase [Bryobacteraceae bacterium]|nr:class I SAM-dependent methyltransferase [Bryobacteraceae bacterium]MCX7603532.1 class I SAM-dependent methyltransferase [Bryobacteraceae bacterium]
MNYFATRFRYDPRREILWKALCDFYFSRLAPPDGHVLELGAGYCHFINNIRAARKTAVDLSADCARYAAPGVRFHEGSVTDLSFLEDGSVDLAFASNLFEHLTQAEFSRCLRELKRTLKPSGQLVILQPNFRRAYKEYFDDYTHISVYSDVSLCDFLQANGYRILECRPGFLPFSIVSRLPVRRSLILLYLLSPWKPFAKQMLVRAAPEQR